MTAPQPITITPIATVIGGHTEVLDDYQGGVESVIRLHDTFPLETLQGIEEFSHLTVVWHFSRASPADVQLHARSPRLLGVDGRDLLVTDLDAVDGTPVLDIAPYFSAMGPRGPVREPAWPGEMLVNYWADASSR